MENDTTEDYTTKDLGKDVAKAVALGVAETAAAYGIILVAGFTYVKVVEFRARRAAKKNQPADPE